MRIVLALLAALALGGCRLEVYDPPPRRVLVFEDGHRVVYEEVVETAPPSEPVDVVAIGVCPGPDYVWVPGYWAWRGGVWVRVGGRWACRPVGYRYYRPGAWVYYGGRHRWRAGVWVR